MSIGPLWVGLAMLFCGLVGTAPQIWPDDHMGDREPVSITNCLLTGGFLLLGSLLLGSQVRRATIRRHQFEFGAVCLSGLLLEGLFLAANLRGSSADGLVGTLVFAALLLLPFLCVLEDTRDRIGSLRRPPARGRRYSGREETTGLR